MRQYRIVAEPRLGSPDSYIIQHKGCGPLAFIWWTHKTVSHAAMALVPKYFWSQEEAEKALQELRRYDSAESRIVKTCGCNEKD